MATTELTEDPEDNGEEGVIILEIESHEEGYLAKILLPEGETAECDVAIAVVCENDADVAAFADFPLERCAAIHSDPPRLYAHTCHLARHCTAADRHTQ